jgi:hypothetical protein
MMRRRLAINGAVLGLMLPLVIGLGPAAPARAQGGSLPQVCMTGQSTYKVEFVGVGPSPVAGRFVFGYRLTAINSAALKKISRVVVVVSRGVVPSDITNVYNSLTPPSPISSVQKSGFGTGDSATKVGTGDTNAFVVAIPIQPGTALTIPFFLESKIGRVGLMSIGVDTGSAGFATCLSNVTDTVAGPTGIVGPAVADTPVDFDSVIAASSILTSPANNCPIEVVRNGAGTIVAVQYAPHAPASCLANDVEKVPLSELFVDGLSLHHIGDGNAGNGLFVLGSTDKCVRVCDSRTGFCYLVSTTGTSVNGCKTH